MKKRIKILASFIIVLMASTFILSSCSKGDDVIPPSNEPLPVPRRG